MNKVILMGRLTREPDIRYSQGERQMVIARFTLAVDRRVRSSNGESLTDFISCIAFDRPAEFAEKYLHQGTKIALTGKIQTGSYTKRDNSKVYTTDIVVEEMKFAESKAASANYGTGNYSTGNQNQQSADKDGFMNIPDGVEDDDLPFN